MTDWHHTTDLLVVGSGGGGMTAALVAKIEGLDALVLEKTEYVGGSTACSGAGLWIPNNDLMAAAGMPDSTEEALTYMAHTVGDRVPKARQEAYVRMAREMVRYLTQHTPVRFQLMPKYPDYYPERPGGKPGGRGIEATIFAGGKLGPRLRELRRPPLEAPGGVGFTATEFRRISMCLSDPMGFVVGAKVLFRHVLGVVFGRKYLAMGRALAGSLWAALQDHCVPLWLKTEVRELIVADGRIVGVAAVRDGQPVNIRANRGVVLASGDFAHNRAMREQFQRAPITSDWTLAAPGNCGDGIRLGEAVGAAVDLMEDAWWGPTTWTPGEPPLFLVAERAWPGGIIVNSTGRRFVNEAAPYVDVVRAMYEAHRNGCTAVPSQFIMDQRFRRHYVFGKFVPGQVPRKYLDNGYFTRADTLDELAAKIGVDRLGLVETVARFNAAARAGKDADFGRGESAYDRYYGDPKVKPNPCLAPIETPPYYAVKVYPGDLGTKGGLLTDERARVLRTDGTVIEGLYAVGNTAASVMGNTYPGPGSTIGPAMTFGYIAALDAARTR